MKNLETLSLQMVIEQRDRCKVHLDFVGTILKECESPLAECTGSE
jgi:hypothetical protein